MVPSPPSAFRRTYRHHRGRHRDISIARENQDGHGAAPLRLTAVWLPHHLMAAGRQRDRRASAPLSRTSPVAKVERSCSSSRCVHRGAASHPPGAAVAASSSPVSRFFSGLVPTLFAFGGAHYALWVAGEMKNPRRDVPLALVAGVCIVIVVYLLANWAYLRLLGYDGVVASRALAADAVSMKWPNAGARIIAGAVALSAFGVLNVQILSGPRLLYGMARDGVSSPCSKPHPRFATPPPRSCWSEARGDAGDRRGKNAIDHHRCRSSRGVLSLTGAALVVLRAAGATPTVPRVPLYRRAAALCRIGDRDHFRRVPGRGRAYRGVARAPVHRDGGRSLPRALPRTPLSPPRGVSCEFVVARARRAARSCTQSPRHPRRTVAPVTQSPGDPRKSLARHSRFREEVSHERSGK
jgi:hypothetical protein